MPSTPISNRRKSKKRRKPRRNWLELPEDLTINILHRVGAFDILVNVKKVCWAWPKICKDPAMWRVIYLDHVEDPNDRPPLQEMCKNVVDRSQGQLVDITMVIFCDDDLLLYVAGRSSQLRRLQIDCSHGTIFYNWTEAFKKFPLLEELSLYKTEFTREAIEAVGRYCPMLKTLKVNDEACSFDWEERTGEDLMLQNDMAIAIGENLHELEHLELLGDIMTNIGLQAILDGCRHLKSLDLRKCLYIDVKGDIEKRCSQQIKCLKLPHNIMSIKEYKRFYTSSQYENQMEAYMALFD